MIWIPGLPGSLNGFTILVTIGVAVALLIAALIVLRIVYREQQHY
jgi:hypothetical protein